MKHTFRDVIFVFVISVLASNVICSQSIQAKGEDVKSFPEEDIATVQTVQIELKKPVVLDALFSVGDNFSSDEIILESEFTFDNEAIYDFYLISSKREKKNIKEDYIKNRKAFLADTKKVVQMSSANSNNVENILVSKITVTGKKGDINEIKKGLEISNINVKPSQSVISSKVYGRSMPKEAHLLDDKTIDTKTSSVVASSALLDNLVPNSGTSYFYPSSSGGRFVQQNMKWNSINLSAEQTYEHDVWLYN